MAEDSTQVTSRATTRAATIFTALAVIVGAFQLALLVGAPWGFLTWGGRVPGRLPASMRAAAVVSALLMVGFALLVRARAGLVTPAWQARARRPAWFVVAYCAVGVVANAVTPSPWERIVWLPVVSAMLFCSLVVARGESGRS